VVKRYSEIGVHDALYIAARDYPGGIEALALRMGISPNVLRNKLRPDIETHHTTLENFAEIVEFLDATKPDAGDLAVDALMWRLNRVSVRLPHGDDVDSDKLLSLVAELFSHDGQLAEQIRKALDKDNFVDDKELARIEKAVQESSETLMTVRNEARQKHAADKAKAGKR
jgi:hypothetical protein